MPDLSPFLVSGLALGAIYALSGVGLAVLYRTTGTVNLAYGAIGALGAFVTWQLVQDGRPGWLAYAIGVLLATGLSTAYGVLINPLLAHRDRWSGRRRRSASRS